MFSKILIANRGEIACRIMRTAHRLGIQCVAVYSEADAHALHVKLADEAVCIGPPPSKESYLRSDKIIAAALQTRAQAIHPGYGFLSENADFAEACAQAGICFIGPPVAAIRAMGSKSRAKEIMAQAGVPLVPGYHGEKQDLATLQAAAEKIAYPILLKAAAGGGGKGMRVIWQAHGFEAALASAKREAQASFGNDQILVEKYLTKPRHIEIQVFADQRGNTIYLFERDCSIQRRHQKIIEEAPAPHISPELRGKIGNAAVKAAQAVNYVGAGTVEFLLDEDGSFYFMEMNTRLQVEHPVTELITKQDLVEWQLRIAQGEPLPYQQEELKIHGHAFEVRVYAEDPDNDFLPSIGTIKYLTTPHENKHVRLDTGISQNDTISPYYDPMLSKLITWDEDRHSALQQLITALSHYQVVGVTTNLNLLSAIAQNHAFAEGDLDTGFIVNHTQELFIPRTITPTILTLASIYLLHLQNKKACRIANASLDPYSPWQQADNWRLNLPAEQVFSFIIDHQIHRIVARTKEQLVRRSLIGGSDVSASSNASPGHASTFALRATADKPLSPGYKKIYEQKDYVINCMEQLIEVSNVTIKDHDISATINEQNTTANIFVDGEKIYLLHQGYRYHFALANHELTQQEITATKSLLTSPMPGKIVALLAKAGTEVEQGAGLAVVEAMKMEHTINAPSKGIVKEWYFQTGDLVDEGVELLKFEESNT